MSSIRPYPRFTIYPNTKNKNSFVSKKKVHVFLKKEVHFLNRGSSHLGVQILHLEGSVFYYKLTCELIGSSLTYHKKFRKIVLLSKVHLQKKEIYVRIARGSGKYDMVCREIQLQKRKFTYVILGSYQLYE